MNEHENSRYAYTRNVTILLTRQWGDPANWTGLGPLGLYASGADTRLIVPKASPMMGSTNFRSAWPLEETRRRLVKLTRWTKDCPDLTGSVTADHVKLSVSRLSRSNGTAFRGQIKELNGEVVLEGRFSTSAYTQATSILSLLFLAAMATGVIVNTLATMVDGGDVAGGLGSVLAFIAALTGFGALMLWNGSPVGKDVARLTEAIEQALGK